MRNVCFSLNGVILFILRCLLTSCLIVMHFRIMSCMFIYEKSCILSFLHLPIVICVHTYCNFSFLVLPSHVLMTLKRIYYFKNLYRSCRLSTCFHIPRIWILYVYYIISIDISTECSIHRILSKFFSTFLLFLLNMLVTLHIFQFREEGSATCRDSLILVISNYNLSGEFALICRYLMHILARSIDIHVRTRNTRVIESLLIACIS